MTEREKLKQPEVLRCIDGEWVGAIPEQFPLTWNEKIMRFLRRAWNRRAER